MAYRPEMYGASHKKTGVMSGLLLLTLVLSISTVAIAQDRDRDRDDDRGRDTVRITRLEPGTVIPVRTNEAIDVERGDNRVYTGIVDQDVVGTNGRLAIRRGSNVELIVRVARDNDLILDLESVVVRGQRYAVRTEPRRVESGRDDSLIGGIIGALDGGEVRGRVVRIPRNSVVTFRLERPLDVGVRDRGSIREGRHYHDYYDQDRNR
jgi:hypothetical protein